MRNSMSPSIYGKVLDTNSQQRFQWVVCQLDHLCDLRTDKAKRQALATLPPTLTETYERLLTTIDGQRKEIRSLVQNCLHCIAHSPEEMMPISLIHEAASVSKTSICLEDDKIIEEEDIFRWCGSLVRKFSVDGRIQFVHFTVSEFLRDTCAGYPRFDRYSTSHDGLPSYIATLHLRYINLDNFGEPEPGRIKLTIQHFQDRTNTRRLYEISAVKWPEIVHQDMMEDDENVSILLYKLFNIKKSATFCY